MSAPLDDEAVSLEDLLYLRVLAAPDVQAADYRGGAAVKNWGHAENGVLYGSFHKTTVIQFKERQWSEKKCT